MRKKTPVLAVLMIGFGVQAALALSAEDDMAAWVAASDAEKSGLADEIMSRAGLSGHVGRSELLDCLNQASSVSGHRDLPIGEVAEACLHPGGPGDQARWGTAGGRTALSERSPDMAGPGHVPSGAGHG